MTEPVVGRDPGAAYDAVATLYADMFSDVLDRTPLDRALLAAFAELVRTHDTGPIADIGCGPGYATAYLHALGVTTFGLDVSPAMIALARRSYPDLRFDHGTMNALDIADGVLGGVLARFSTIHTPPRQLPAVFTEFHRVLAPGGHLLLGFLLGDDPLPRERDHKVLPAYVWSPDSLADLLHHAGLVEVARMLCMPQLGGRFHEAHLLVRKP